MRYESIRIRGLGQFDDVELDLTELTGLVAVTGPNGAGKSTLLELLAGGSCYRQCPTRGSLVKLAGGRRDGLLEVRVAGGATYTLKHFLDGVSGKSEASVTNGQGQAVLETTKVREFDAWAAKHLMPPEVLYSGAVAVQGRRGFLDLTPGDRKGMFLRAIGNEHLEAKADKARERAREARRDVEVAERATEDERARTGDLAEAQGALDEARRVADEATETVTALRAVLEVLRVRGADGEKAVEDRKRRAAVQARRNATDKRLADLNERLKNNRMLLDQAEEIRGAVSRETKTGQAVEKAKADHVTADREVVAAEARLDTAKAAEQRAADMVRQRDERVSGIEERLADEDDVLAAVKALPTLRQTVLGLERMLDDAEASVAQANDLIIHGKDTRIVNLRTGLAGINDSFDEDHELRAKARATLDGDDEAQKAQDTAPVELDGRRLHLANVRQSLTEARDLVAEGERFAALAPGLETARAELAEAEKGLTAVEESLEAARKDSLVADGERADAQKVLDDAAGILSAAETEKRSVPMKLIALAPKLATAEDRVEQLTPDIAAAQKDLNAVDAELDELPDASDVEPVTEGMIAEAEKRLERGEDVAGRAGVSIGTTQALVTRAEEGAARIAELVMEERAAAERYSDWERLSQDLGRDGLQAYEIDAAVPELNAICCDLLHSCHGPRFTTEVTTKRLDSKGKRELEGLDVRVIDTEKGRDDMAETYSGGELGIVGEALALGITQISCRRAGLERPSIVRDESGAALDPENTRAYISMLRRAMNAMGAQHVLLVSHQPGMVELCDSRIEVSDTGLTVI